MNATTLYVSTCRYILQADFENSESWGDLYRLLPYLRQSLSCCVCGALLVEPQGPNDSNCQHFVCRTCLGRKMILKPSCSWCKNYGKFADVPQINILLSCYKKLCEYIAATPIARSFIGANGEKNSTQNILQEGMLINASHESSSPIKHGKSLDVLDILAKLNLTKMRGGGSKPSGGRRGRRKRDSSGGGASPPSPRTGNAEAAGDSRLDGLCNGIDGSLSDHLDASDDHNSFYSSSLSNSDTPGIKLKKKRRHSSGERKSKKKKKKRDKDKEKKSCKSNDENISDSRQRRLLIRQKHRHKILKRLRAKNALKMELNNPRHEKLVNGIGESNHGLPVSESLLDTPRKKTLVISGHRALLMKAGKILPEIQGCRCGTWNRYPGANTCRGIRCPCFMTEKGCIKCKCRGCRNPFEGVVTEKKKKHMRRSSRSDLVNGTAAESDPDVDVTNI